MYKHQYLPSPPRKLKSAPGPAGRYLRRQHRGQIAQAAHFAIQRGLPAAVEPEGATVPGQRAPIPRAKCGEDRMNLAAAFSS
jgi:hypothetical protein